jgi:hypothetical protein
MSKYFPLISIYFVSSIFFSSIASAQVSSPNLNQIYTQTLAQISNSIPNIQGKTMKGIVDLPMGQGRKNWTAKN